MAARTETGGDMMSAINVTPFVDIVLVLLVVLMVSSVHIIRAAIQVELPQAASAGQVVNTTLNVVVTKDGQVKVDGERTTLSALAVRVRSERAADPKVQVVIAADKGVVYDSVVQAIDTVKRNGVTSFALNIQRAAEAD